MAERYLSTEGHARPNAIQACYLLVAERFGDKAGQWLLREIAKVEEEEKGGLRRVQAASLPSSGRSHIRSPAPSIENVSGIG